jgi:hypothetical protein
MLATILAIGAWALVGIVIVFWGHWIEPERGLFDHWNVKRGHLE